jgi:hypothetical protein
MSPEERRRRRKILKNRPHHRRPKNRRPNTKITGERSEAAFLARAIQKNFGVAKPWGDSRRYDFILDNGEILIRIQVKCTESIRAFAYETRATYTKGNQHVAYTKKDIDFIAAHVVPLDLWYIIPVEVCTPQPMLRFYPHRKAKKMRLEQYKEAWHLILPKKGVVNGRIDLQASADQASADHADHASAENATADHASADHASAENADTADHADTASARPTTKLESVVILSEAKDLCISPPLPTTAGKLKTPDPTSPIAQLHHYRQLCATTPTTTLDPKQAPWPLPKVRILAHRQGPHLLPEPSIKSP